MTCRIAVLAILLAAVLVAPAFSQCTLNTASPSVTICTPANGATVDSPVHVVAGTTDNEFNVSVLQIYVDGTKVYQLLAPTLDTNVTMATGTHRLTVQAIDSGNRIFKSSESITVGSAPPPSSCTATGTQPSVTICSPASGATVTSPVHVAANTNCQCTVRTMQIYLDGSKAYQVSGTSVSTDLTIADGSHRLTVQAIDSTNATFKSAVNITVGTAPPPPPPPPPGGTNSPIKHVIVVVMQNRGFDHLFGTMAGVEGISPNVPGYRQTDANGNSVTPFLEANASTADLNHSRSTYLAAWDKGLMDKYAATNGTLSMAHYDNTMPGIDKLWTWAQTYALADNYFPSTMSNGPSQQLYLAAASDNNFPWSVQPSYGPCQKADAAASPFTFKNVGDQMNTASVTWAWFAENYAACGGGYLPVQNPFQYFTSTQNSSNIKDLSNFYTALTNGTLPSVSYIQPNPGHSMHPGSGSVTTAANWLDGLIHKVQNSSSWPDTAVVITWDESGGWWDHVPPPQIDSQGLGARVPLIVISPYAKKGYVSHVQMDHVSILKWIQWNWALGELNTREAKSVDIGDMFTF
jgi:phospholipase C